MRVRSALMIVMVALISAAGAIAASSDDAFFAYQKGDYKTAIKLLTPLAEAGDVHVELRRPPPVSPSKPADRSSGVRR